MCQAIVKPAGVLIDKAILKRSWQDNKDGAGFCFVNDAADEVVIKKGFFKFKTFWRAYQRYQDRAVLIHFRWATHGEKVEANCHPFSLAKDAALIHNGVLSSFTPSPVSKLSDTRLFCDGFLGPGLRMSGLSSFDYLSSPALKGFIEVLIGQGNKLAAMTTQGVVIFNEGQGEWSGGAWYSAGFPEESPWPEWNDEAFLGFKGNSAVNHSGINGEDTWYEDMMSGAADERAIASTGGKRTPSGIIAWSDIEDEDDEDDKDGCVFCQDEHAGRLYQIDGQSICGGCWNVYTGAN